MVNKTELRVGNKIYSGNNSNILTVDEIRYTTVRVSYIRLDTNQPHVSISNYEDFNPIPLSPEILEKFGFKKYEWQNALFLRTKFGDLYIHFYRGRIITKMMRVSGEGESQTMFSLPFIGNKKSVEDILYLHQLQNFVFSLTSLELPFTNK